MKNALEPCPLAKSRKTRNRSETHLQDRLSDFQKELPRKLIDTISSCEAPFVAIGIDMAAQSKGWGLSVISLDTELREGSLRLLLPYTRRWDWFDQKRRISPSVGVAQRDDVDNLRLPVTVQPTDALVHSHRVPRQVHMDQRVTVTL